MTIGPTLLSPPHLIQTHMSRHTEKEVCSRIAALIKSEQTIYCRTFSNHLDKVEVGNNLPVAAAVVEVEDGSCCGLFSQT